MGFDGRSPEVVVTGPALGFFWGFPELSLGHGFCDMGLGRRASKHGHGTIQGGHMQAFHDKTLR